ncbi:uncharacterized protein ALPK3A isoform X2 [Latimeria chalumnae]|uniref:uncharacterized protein ALPK3A isoform X2 n=1 Tax=Latimeria chalumnae TaxID=7897 RepID=UPI0003C13BA1|nr:PREDICTED: alpha-protein kinase 3 isoform X2 [Latimeria chalumnae]|eukprot:XP_005995721.1 PREDICTED: alpha-protein kinase 3 isoform X2 [Latimeria chalumnae]
MTWRWTDIVASPSMKFSETERSILFTFTIKIVCHKVQCTEDDAAIYQASARNSKGIVSCSGVLEVGTMTEYKIHQRWFAKLKQKADAKRRELEESRKRGKENLEQGDQLRTVSPERAQRKRRSPGEANIMSATSLRDKEKGVKVHIQDPESRFYEAEAAGYVNGFVTSPKGMKVTGKENMSQENSLDNDDQFLAYIYETVEIITKRPPAKDFPGKKKRKTKGEDEGEPTNQQEIKSPDVVQIDGRESSEVWNSGQSLFQYLAESAKGQASETTPKSSKSEEFMELDTEKTTNWHLNQQDMSNTVTKTHTRLLPTDVWTEGGAESKANISTRMCQEPASPNFPALEEPSSGEVYFSLKDIYFDNSVNGAERDLQQIKKKEENEAMSQFEKVVIKKEDFPQERAESLLPVTLADHERKPEEAVKGCQLQEWETLNKEVAELDALPLSVDLQVSGSEKENQVVDPTVYNGQHFLQEESLFGPKQTLTDTTSMLISDKGDEEAEMVVDAGLPPETVMQSYNQIEKLINSQQLIQKGPDSLQPDLTVQQLIPEVFFEVTKDEKHASTEETRYLENIIPPGVSVPQHIMEDSESYFETKKYDQEPLLLPTDGERKPPQIKGNLVSEPIVKVVPDVKPIFETLEKTHEEFKDIIETVKQAKDNLASNEYIPVRAKNTIPILNEASALETTSKGSLCVEKVKDGNLDGSAIKEVCLDTEGKLIPEIIFLESDVIMLEEGEQEQVSEMRKRSEEQMTENVTCKEMEASAIEEKYSVSGNTIVSERTVNAEVQNVQSKEINDALLNVHAPCPEVITPFEQKLPLNTSFISTEMPLSLSPLSETVVAQDLPLVMLLRDVKVGLDSGKNIALAPLTEKTIDNVQSITLSAKSDKLESINLATSLSESESIKAKADIMSSTTTEELKEKPLSVPTTFLDHTQMNKISKSNTSVPVSLVTQDKKDQINSQEDLPPPKHETQQRNIISSLKDSLYKFLNLTPTVEAKTDKKDEVKSNKNNTEITQHENEPVVNTNITVANTNVLSSMDSPNLSPLSPRKARTAMTVPTTEESGSTAVPSIVVGDTTLEDNTIKMEKSETSETDIFAVFQPQDNSIKQKPTENLPIIPSATPEELASGARRKIFVHKPKQSDESEVTTSDSLGLQQEAIMKIRLTPDQESANLSPGQLRRNQVFLQAPVLPHSPPMERRSPTVTHRMSNLEAPVSPNTPPMERRSPTVVRKVSNLEAPVSPHSPPMERRSPTVTRKMSNLEAPVSPHSPPMERRSPTVTRKMSNLEAPLPQHTPPMERRSPIVVSKMSNLEAPVSPHSPTMERRSPTVAHKMTTLEVPKLYEEPMDKSETTHMKKPESDKIIYPEDLKQLNDPFRAPQVIRKVRAEQFSDASGNLKLWCQFFNVLSDSTITWYRDEIPITEVRRSAGDEAQVALAIVQASSMDCGVYQCTIQNKYGIDSTDFLLSFEVLSGFISKEDIEVGEEIEMTPMLFRKGLTDSEYWGDKFFGRIVTEEMYLGEGCLRKACRVKVIYGLDPIFESGSTCIIKVRNPIAYGTNNENNLIERNREITIQECKIQNTTKEYCKIFAAEARAVPNFGQALGIIPLHMIYRPANNIPYATIEEEMKGHFVKYCSKDSGGNLIARNDSEIEQKCCTFQHWIYQWTNGDLLVTDLEGAGGKITNVRIATKSKGYQGLKENCSLALIEQFITLHQCNHYCELLGLRSLKTTDTLQQPAKPKGSKSPSFARKTTSTQSSPQIQKKSFGSPQATRRGSLSPKAIRRASISGDTRPTIKHKTVEIPKSVRLR